MKKLFSLFKKAPRKLLALISMLALTVAIPSALLAWGPSRTTFTIDHPADYVTFNSITDNPAHGDERNFMQVKDATAGNETYVDSIVLTPGHQYTVYMYYHNNAASNLNLVANGSYVRTEIPALVHSNTSNVTAVGYVGASNANPTFVWDNIYFTNPTNGDIALRLVDGSATIHNFGATNGQVLSDNIVSTGAAIGYNALDGNVPGCNEYAGYVTFNLVADQADFTIEKQVRIVGTTEWSESVNAKAGDSVEYRIQYRNTGTTLQNNVGLVDTLPANMTYVAGSTTIKNANYPDGHTISDNIVTAAGINIGNYTPGSNAYVKFTARVNSNTDSLICGQNNLVNTVRANTNNGWKEDTATVVVNKSCQPNECKPGIPVGDPRCTPSELPKTGTSDMLLSTIGLGIVTASVAYYLSSRKLANN